jgi:hypothetical protein
LACRLLISGLIGSWVQCMPGMHSQVLINFPVRAFGIGPHTPRHEVDFHITI